MKTVRLDIPDDMSNKIRLLAENVETFILSAIREKLAKEKALHLKKSLIEGYKNSRAEDLQMAKDFEAVDFEQIG